MSSPGDSNARLSSMSGYYKFLSAIVFWIPVIIRTAKPADLSPLIDLERASATAAHWSEQQYRQLFEPAANVPERLALVITASEATASEAAASENSGEISSDSQPLRGFLVARHVASEWELENIVVVSEERRKGLGRRLLQAFLDHAKSANSDSVFLEVRESNTAARRFYEKNGFHESGRRKSYYTNPSGYTNPSEDAILYRHDLS
jgi:[ribosomal protein S18]-alanine N-acetyltransferase